MYTNANKASYLYGAFWGKTGRHFTGDDATVYRIAAECDDTEAGFRLAINKMAHDELPRMDNGRKVA